jgi:hypothetical protein
MWRSRRFWVAAGALLALTVVALLSFGPLVRWRIAREAARRQLEVEIGAVRPGWFCVRLAEVNVGLERVPGVAIHLDQVEIELGATLRARELVARGGRISLVGSPDELADAVRAWRAARPPSTKGGARLSWRADRLSVSWSPSSDATPPFTAKGVFVERGDLGYRGGVDALTVSHGAARIDVASASINLDPTGALRTGNAERVQLVYEVPPNASDPVAAPVSPLEPPPPPLPVVVAAKRGRHPAPPPSIPPPETDPPQVPLPDLHAMRARAGTLATLVAARMPEGSSIQVAGLELQLAVRGDRIALGPGPLAVERSAERVRVSFSTGERGAQGEAPRLSLEATFPLTGGDVIVQLSGGPVALSLLGVKSGSLGLTDVERATVAGKSRFVLSAPEDALTFDTDMRVRGLAVHNPRLARETVRGLDFGVSARGLLSAAGELRLDHAELNTGALSFRARGGLEQAPDHLAASLVFDVPTSSCQTLLESVPSALIPTVRGARMAGTFGARGRVSFDSRKLDELVLEYNIDDQCKMIEAPPELSRDRFNRAFSHRIYLPDGTMSDELTGPGTPSWTALDRISPFMQAAVLTTEDGAFLHHHGFSHPAIRNALVANLKARRFLRGASTITMQLAKNLFLSRDKTLARKLEEVILTDYLEQVFRKDDMMELYLNIIEFGPNVYGVTRAARHYFGRKPEELNLAECLFLSSIMPSPVRNHRIYEKGEISESWMKHVRQLMEIAERTGKISKSELADGLAETVVFHHEDTPSPPPRAPVTGTHLTGDDEADWEQLN